jgi:hypothetical protein
MLSEDDVQAVNTALGTCLNPSAPSACPAPKPAPASFPQSAPAVAPVHRSSVRTPNPKPPVPQAAPPLQAGGSSATSSGPTAASTQASLTAADADSDRSLLQGGVIAATVAAVVAIILIGLGLFAFVLLRRRRSAFATSASVKHGHGEVLMPSVGHPAPAEAGSALPHASPEAMSPPVGFAGSAPAAPREAATPAALIVGAGMAGPPVQEGNGKYPTEDDFAMLSPAALPPTALVKLERSGTGSSAAKGIGHQSLTSNPERASLSIVGSSLVAPLTVLNYHSRCAFMSSTSHCCCLVFQLEP